MHSQSLFFTLFGDYIIDRGGQIRGSSLVRLMGEFGLSEPAVRAGLFRLVQKGLVQVTKEGHFSHYLLTAHGLRRLREGTRRVYHRTPHPWDGWWRMVVYQIRESEREIRDQLRRELVWHGFGLLAQSTWITPNPLEEVVHELIDEYVVGHGTVDLFRTQYIGHPDELVQRCWNLPDVARAYQTFMADWTPILSHVDQLADNEAFVMRVRLVHEYRKFLNIDPDLPMDLLPSPWIGHQAANLFTQLHNALTPAADRFFDEKFQP